jgi:hypothetical protein
LKKKNYFLENQIEIIKRKDLKENIIFFLKTVKTQATFNYTPDSIELDTKNSYSNSNNIQFNLNNNANYNTQGNATTKIVKFWSNINNVEEFINTFFNHRVVHKALTREDFNSDALENSYNSIRIAYQ